LVFVTIGCLVIVRPSAATAASTTEPPATTGTAPEACALLTPADVQAVLGGTVGRGDQTTAPTGGETICEWTVTTGANGSGYAAQLDVKTPFSRKQFTQQREIASGRTKTVKQLGDAAFSERVKIGHQVFDDLWVHAGHLAFRLEVLKDLGSKPLERLGSVVLSKVTTTS
jgi:hypothetical protein